MASLIVAAGILTYDKVKTTRQKRRDRKEGNAQRFSELEKDNAARMARLQPQGYAPPSTPLSAERSVGRGEAVDPFADGPGRESFGDGGSMRERGSEEEERMAGSGRAGVRDEPPAYGSLVREEAPRKRGLKGMFGRGKEGGGVGDGVVR
ncbi:hypothetical protein MMC26_004195 [Xylographa opegraphella]|nr:hypothetical protein [Xylographa opegraphella]